MEIESLGVFGACNSLKHLELPSLKVLEYWGDFFPLESLEVLSLPSLELTGELIIDADTQYTLMEHRGDKYFPPFAMPVGRSRLKKLVIPKKLINKDFDLDILDFEIELV